jgi:pyruvate carboxylase
MRVSASARSLPCTITFLARIIRHPEFVAGQVDTKFLERHPELLRPEA